MSHVPQVQFVLLTREEYNTLVNRVNAVEGRCTDLEDAVGGCQRHLEQIEEAEHAADDTQPDIYAAQSLLTSYPICLETEQGPEFCDGTDADGFPGGDQRMGHDPYPRLID